MVPIFGSPCSMTPEAKTWRAKTLHKIAHRSLSFCPILSKICRKLQQYTRKTSTIVLRYHFEFTVAHGVTRWCHISLKHYLQLQLQWAREIAKIVSLRPSFVSGDTLSSGCARNFHLRARCLVWVWVWVVGPRGESSVGGLYGTEAEGVCRHCLQILAAETIKIWKFAHNTTLILDQYV